MCHTGVSHEYVGIHTYQDFSSVYGYILMCNSDVCHVYVGKHACQDFSSV